MTRQYPFADDEVSRTETTAGWLSNGVSQPATLIGGTGADTFTVFRNLATLNLIGGADKQPVRDPSFRPVRLAGK